MTQACPATPTRKTQPRAGIQAAGVSTPSADRPRKDTGSTLDTKVTIRDNTKALDDILRALSEKHVMVGIPAETADRDDSPINNAAIGYILETGAPERNLPARPFLRPGVASAAGDVAKVARTTLGRALAFGRPRAETDRTIQRGLEQIGIVATNAVKRLIDAGDFAPLAPSTLYRRQHRKDAPRSGDKPMVDTGQLRNAVTYVVRKA